MFMHVTTGRATDPEAVRRQVYEWVREFRPGAVGYLGATCGVSPDGRFVEVARFESEAAAHAVRDAPGLDAWRAEIQKCLKDIEFHDSTEIFTVLGGANDDAGFVQLVRGRVKDRDKLVSLLSRPAELETIMSKARPDVIGEIVVLHADGTYSDVVYFTSEEHARANEAAPLPADAEAMLGEMMAAVEIEEYVDLPQPWLLT